MFKKGKKKSREEVAKNEENLVKGKEISKNAPSFDQTDGFDKDGFVDLQPESSNATVLGPRQSCKYVGTFAVMSGTDGRRTLNTHRERTSYVKEKLREYRQASNGLAVLLQVSTDGLKVYSADAKRVRMAHSLQRISFATCDPDFCLFAFMTHSPSPMGVAVHAHIFVTHRPKQVQDITAMIGKAFKLAFAASKLPEKPSQGSVKLVESPSQQGRRWAKHEASRGHDHSEHAEAAAQMKKKQTASKQNSSSTDGSPVLERAGVRRQKGAGTPPQRPGSAGQRSSRLDDDVVPDNLAKMFTPLSIAATSGEKTSQERSGATPPPLPPSRPQSHSFVKTPSEPLPVRAVSCSFTESATILEQPLADKEVAPALPPREKTSKRIQSPEIGSTAIEDSAGTSGDRPMSGSGQSGMPESKTKELLKGASREEDAGVGEEEARNVTKATSHHEEYWYMPGIPREFIMDMLQSSEEGSFFVRDSQSKPGCHALTVRVSEEFQPSGFGNYLITPVPDGVKLEGFSTTHPDLMTLIEHHACHSDGLPCKLLLAGSNMLCEDNEDEDYMIVETLDPDYRLLSDFHSMMEELE